MALSQTVSVLNPLPMHGNQDAAFINIVAEMMCWAVILLTVRIGLIIISLANYATQCEITVYYIDSEVSIHRCVYPAGKSIPIWNNLIISMCFLMLQENEPSKWLWPLPKKMSMNIIIFQCLYDRKLVENLSMGANS